MNNRLKATGQARRDHHDSGNEKAMKGFDSEEVETRSSGHVQSVEFVRHDDHSGEILAWFALALDRSLHFLGRGSVGTLRVHAMLSFLWKGLC